MEFFKNIKTSVYGPGFYQGLIQKPISFSFKYYFLFALLGAFIATIIFSFSMMPQIKTAFDDLKNEVIKNYPQNLVVKIENGKVSTNAQEPFYLEYSGKSADIKNLLAIDTKTAFDVDQFYAYQSYCLLTETSLVCRDNDGLKVQSLAAVPNTTIDKNLIDSWVQKASVFFKLIYPLFFIMMLFGFYFAITTRLVYLFFLALLIWAVAKLKKIKIGYWKSYQFGLHLMTPAFIITYLVSILTPNTNIPWFFTIIALLAAIVNLKALAPASTQEPPKQSSNIAF